METITSSEGISRRELLKRCMIVGAGLAVGTGFVAGSTAAWAMETKHVSPKQMATLIRMARDVYPHNHIPDEYYARAMKGYDSVDAKANVGEGVQTLDKLAREKGYEDYLSASWEDDRIEVLKSIEDSSFFQTVRGNLVTGLYNQKEVWPFFGYEGESYSKGGYINRGYNDITWV
ncbi:MAG: Twin-arginine translocation pathway signal [Litoricola sp.]|jgi:hypothetical protein|nr:Twin-arginine translocation pathway signal [Litorivicinus sp.]|tara:strand:- start:571 stop:1095 length:525 start_codon:yes stop_codon:yes gene_type:complete